MGNTLKFSEKNKGWTSFERWMPNLMCRINNRFFTIKNGQLYRHHDRSNPITNTFYGVKTPSEINTILNEFPSEDKIFKNIIQESSSPWKTTIETNLSNGVIEQNEFNQRESKWFAHTRKNEDDSNLIDRVQGIGNIVSIDGNDVTFNSLPTLISVGEALYQINADEQEILGTITNINKDTYTITLNSLQNTPIALNFCYSLKNARVQGAEIRGYFAKVKLENDDDGNSELFAINSNIVKSFVPTKHE